MTSASRVPEHLSDAGREGETSGGRPPATESFALQLRVKRSELMIEELEAVALRLFEERGFRDVTVEEIASEARISTRTFYRYFPNKEDVLQVQIDRRSRDLRAAERATLPTRHRSTLSASRSPNTWRRRTPCCCDAGSASSLPTPRC